MPDGERSEASAVAFEGSVPILRVRSLRESLTYYVRVLGFAVDWQNGLFASVSRGRCHIMLSEGDQGNPGAWVWIGVSDADALFKELSPKGANVRHPPSNYPWALEMQVQDPDRHALRLGSEPKQNETFGEWLDMTGHHWRMAPGGGWTRVEPA